MQGSNVWNIYKEEDVNRLFHVVSLLGILLIMSMVTAQMTPWRNWTLLPQEQVDEIIGEASGEAAWNTILETGCYNKERPAKEYSGTFYEARTSMTS
jgi:hypothetical protein